MFSQVSALLSRRGNALLEGKFDELVHQYSYPLPLYLQKTQMIVHSQAEALAILSRMRDAHLERGIVALKPKVVAMEIPRGGRFRVWVEWSELALPVEGSGMSSVVYYCKVTASGIRTEMIDYIRLSRPELNHEFKKLTLVA